MAGKCFARLQAVHRPPWLRALPAGQRAALLAAIDGEHETTAAMYKRFDLQRCTGIRWFRKYVQERRDAVQDYRSRKVQRTGGMYSDPVYTPGRRAVAAAVQRHELPAWFQSTADGAVHGERFPAELVLGHVDAGGESAAFIYRQYNLRRFIGWRAFATFVRRRRAALGISGYATQVKRIEAEQQGGQP